MIQPKYKMKWRIYPALAGHFKSIIYLFSRTSSRTCRSTSMSTARVACYSSHSMQSSVQPNAANRTNKEFKEIRFRMLKMTIRLILGKHIDHLTIIQRSLALAITTLVSFLSSHLSRSGYPELI